MPTSSADFYTRPATVADRVELLRLLIASSPGMQTRAAESLADTMMPGHRRTTWLVVHERTDIACGFAHVVTRPRLTGNGQEASILYFQASADACGAGAGETLLEVVQHWAALQGANTLTHMMPAAAKQAQAFFTTHGFVAAEPTVTLTRAVEMHEMALPTRGSGRASERIADAVPAGATADGQPSAVYASLQAQLPATNAASTSPVWHWIAIVCGTLSLLFTDLWSSDVIRGAVLVIVDVVFVLYLITFFALRRYRRQTTADFDAGAYSQGQQRRGRR